MHADQIVCTAEVKLGKDGGAAQLIDVCRTNGSGCWYLTVTALSPPPFFSMKKNPAEVGDMDQLMSPCQSTSATYSSITLDSSKDNG